MYSLLQLKANRVPVDSDEIPLPETTSEGDGTFNELKKKNKKTII